MPKSYFRSRYREHRFVLRSSRPVLDPGGNIVDVTPSQEIQFQDFGYITEDDREIAWLRDPRNHGGDVVEIPFGEPIPDAPAVGVSGTLAAGPRNVPPPAASRTRDPNTGQFLGGAAPPER